MFKEYLQDLQRIPLFDALAEDVLMAFLEAHPVERRKYAKNACICIQGESVGTVDVVVQGEISIDHLEEEGSQLHFEQFFTGDLFGANLLFSKAPFYPMTLFAREDTVLLRISKEGILFLLKEEDFLMGYLHAISDKTILLTEKIKALSKTTLRKRLLSYLEKEADKTGTSQVMLSMSKKQLAEKLLVERTSLSRELQKLREEGILTFDKNSITLKNSNC